MTPEAKDLHGPAGGDLVIGFSLAHRLAHAPEVLTRTETVLADEARIVRWLFPAVAENGVEAILNFLCRATTVVGRDGNIRHALPGEEAAHLVHGRLASCPICG